MEKINNMENLKLKVKKITEDAILPTQANKGDCFDLYANKDIEVNSFQSVIVPLGLSFDIPEGYRIKIFSRSSLPLKNKIIVSNSVGIIDTGYKNEIGLICHTLPTLIQEGNQELLCNNKVEIKKGQKIAQFQLEKIVDFEIEEVDELDLSNDRLGGFGSTGQ